MGKSKDGKIVYADVPIILRNPAKTKSVTGLPDDLTNLVFDFTGSWKKVEVKELDGKVRKYIVCPKNATHRIDLPLNIPEMCRDNRCIRLLEDQERLSDVCWRRSAELYRQMTDLPEEDPMRDLLKAEGERTWDQWLTLHRFMREKDTVENEKSAMTRPL